MNGQFANFGMLFLVLLVPAVMAWLFALRRRQQKKLEAFVSAHMQAKLCPAASLVRFTWQIWLLGVGLALALVAAARPQLGRGEQVIFKRGRDVIIALDVSRSMLATDVHPNRLERAKTDIVDLIKELRGDRAGLLAFRGKAQLICPLTTDYSFLMQALDGVAPYSAPAGETNIGDAIIKALDAFDNESGAHKAIVLISDGEDLTGKAIEAAAQAAERGIPIFTVGLGGREGSRIPETGDGKQGFIRHDGKDVLTHLDDKTLHAIATTTSGAYIPMATAGITRVTLGTIYQDHLRKIAAQDLEEAIERRYIERYQYFLVPALILMIAACFFSSGRLSTSSRPRSSRAAGRSPLSPARPAATGITLLCISLAVAANAQTNDPAAVPETNAVSVVASVPPGREGARKAQMLYRLGKYEEAAATYLAAAAGSTSRSQDDFRFNAAVAQMKAGNHKAAADILEGLMHSQRRPPDTALALGAALYASADSAEETDAKSLEGKADLLAAAGEAFKESARSEEQAATARKNLSVVLDSLPELQERARIAGLMEKYGTSPPHELAAKMLEEQRELAKLMAAAATNESPSRIGQMEAIAARQRENADLWIPLKGGLLSAAGQSPDTDPQNMAALEQAIEATRDNMLAASDSLRDLDASAAEHVRQSQQSVYHFWKGIAPHTALLSEDIRMQTNVVASLAAGPNAAASDRAAAPWLQGEAGSLTELFKERFAAAVPEEGSPGQAVPSPDGTNTVQTGAISAEDRATILDLSDQAIALQKQAADRFGHGQPEQALPQARESLSILKRIEELLPKPPRQQQQSPQQDSQQNQEQDQQQQQPEDQPQDQPQQQEPQEQEPQEPDSQEEPQQSPEEKDEDDLSEEQARDLLMKALQREKEHEMEKRRNTIPLSPAERDW